MSDVSRTARSALAILGVVLVMALSSPVTATTHAGVNAVPTEDTATLARELWEKALAAKGGRERLRKITNLYVAIDQGRGDRYWAFTVFPSYQFIYTYDARREVTSLQVMNQKKGIAWWQIRENEAKARRFDESEAYQILEIQFRYLMVTHDLDPVPLRVRKEWVGLKRVSVIETDVKGWRVDYFLDPKTHLPLRVDMPIGKLYPVSHILTLDDYASVDGIMMPHKVTHSYKSVSRRGWTDRLKFEINAEYDPKVFEQPPTRKTAAEAWRATKQ